MAKTSGRFDAKTARAELRGIADQLAAAARRAHALGKRLEKARSPRSARARDRAGEDAGSLRLARTWSALVEHVAKSCAEQVQAIRTQARRTGSSPAIGKRTTRSTNRSGLRSLNTELEMLGSLVAGLRNIAESVERGVAVQHAAHAEWIRNLASSLESTTPARRPRSTRRAAA
jgi:hypothetical protein